MDIFAFVSEIRTIKLDEIVLRRGRMMEGVNLIKIYCKQICECHNVFPLYNPLYSNKNSDFYLLQVSSSLAGSSDLSFVPGMKALSGTRPVISKRQIQFHVFFFYFFYSCAGWGYIVAFTRVLIMYQIYCT
jgi:hypothetical protein